MNAFVQLVLTSSYTLVLQIDAKDISEGKGFVSKVYKTVVKFTNAPSGSFTVMMKVPTTECLEKIMEELSHKDDKEVATVGRMTVAQIL